MREEVDDDAELPGLRDALRDEMTRVALEEMARLRAEAAAGDERAARVLERLARAQARKARPRGRKGK